jgi:hypothetical protein
MTTATGLLIDGRLVDFANLRIVPPADHGGPAWCRLDPGDYTARKLPVSIVAIHTTGGHDHQPIHAGAGLSGHARQILDMWSGADRGGGDRVHSAAPLVIDFDGVIYCAADLARTAAYHAQMLNGRSVGIEMCTLPDGGIYEATLDACAGLVEALTHSGSRSAGLFAIPAQIPRGPYRGEPLRRLEVGGVQTDGRGLVGVVGHRNQTSNRGRGDPGDEIWRRLAALGFEGIDYDGGEDLLLGRARQAALNALDAAAGLTWSPLVVDGVCGPASLAAMRRHGITRWRDVPA